MTTDLCRVSHKSVSVGRAPGQAGPALGVEETEWSDRGWAITAGVHTRAPAHGPSCL